MVTLTKDRLIISIETPAPIDLLTQIQTGLIALLKESANEEHADEPVFFGLELLQGMMPTYKDYQQLYPGV